MIAIVVATKGRPDKLRKMIDTIAVGIPIYVYATCVEDVDGSLEDIDFVDFGDKTVIQANNYLIKEALKRNPDTSVVVACDDITFDIGCFETISNEVNKDDTILYGLKCKNMKCNNDAFVCITNRILKETQGSPYNEDYYHFYADTELGDTYKSLGRFKIIEAYMYNFHPSFTGEVDKTHSEGRTEKLIHDKEVYENRNILHSNV